MRRARRPAFGCTTAPVTLRLGGKRSQVAIDRPHVIVGEPRERAPGHRRPRHHLAGAEPRDEGVFGPRAHGTRRGVRRQVRRHEHLCRIGSHIHPLPATEGRPHQRSVAASVRVARDARRDVVGEILRRVRRWRRSDSSLAAPWPDADGVMANAISALPNNVSRCSGTAWLVAGCARRYEATAARSSSLNWNSIRGNAARPSARTPKRNTRASSASDRRPMPVVGSGVMFAEFRNALI